MAIRTPLSQSLNVPSTHDLKEPESGEKLVSAPNPDIQEPTAEPTIPFQHTNSALVKSDNDIQKTTVDAPSPINPERQTPTTPVSPEIVNGWPENCEFHALFCWEMLADKSRSRGLIANKIVGSLGFTRSRRLINTSH